MENLILGMMASLNYFDDEEGWREKKPMIWRVTGGEDGNLVVELRDDGTLFWTEAVTDYFHYTRMGKTIFDDVAQAPLFVYEATSDEGTTAAFLNASLYLPKSIVEGDPPVQFSGDDCIQSEDPMDEMRATVAATLGRVLGRRRYRPEESQRSEREDQARQDPR